jgi:hypothetical protein
MAEARGSAMLCIANPVHFSGGENLVAIVG